MYENKIHHINSYDDKDINQRIECNTITINNTFQLFIIIYYNTYFNIYERVC
jgi:hypothetical protein